MVQKVKEKSELTTIDTTSPRVRMVNRLLRLDEEKKKLGCVGCDVGPIEPAIKNLADINKKITTCRDAMYLFDLRTDVTECLSRMLGLDQAEAKRVARLGISLEDAGMLEQNTLTDDRGVTIVLPTDLVISIAQGLERQFKEGKKTFEFPKRV